MCARSAVRHLQHSSSGLVSDKALGDTRPLLECCKTCTARPKHVYCDILRLLDRYRTVPNLLATELLPFWFQRIVTAV